MAHDTYTSPFQTRYASKEMQYIFSEDNKFKTWRRLWIALAKAEQKQGLPITDEQIAELEAHKDDINYEDAIAREKLVRHDVMSHVYAYGLQCPKAKGIIHLGATSCYVGDNTDVIIMREGLQLVRKKVIGVLANLAKFADEYKAMPCLAYTHCQPAQLTTVGKRATLWMNELYMDLDKAVNRFGDWLQRKTGGRGRITEGFVTGTMVFVIGAMSIMGSLSSGLSGDHTILYSKSVLDGVSALIFASTMGVGVLLSAVPLFLWQGGIALLAALLSPYLAADVVAEINAVGSLLIMAISLNMLGVTKIRVLNLVPAMLLPILLCRFL